MRNFFCRCFLYITTLLFLTTAAANQQLIVEPDMGRVPLLNAIQNANKIDLVMYGFTDLRFVKALITAKNANKEIRVLLQHHPYITEDENQNTIQDLQSAHINLAFPDGDYKLTHQKTFLLDNRTAIVMTFNLTNSAFSKQRNFALIINDPATVQEIQQVFNADWQHQPVTVKHADLVWSPNNSREKLVSAINNAKSDIKVYAQGLNDFQILGALAKAARAGKTVEILTSNETDQSANKKFNFLLKSGVQIHFSKEYVIHAKVIMVDHVYAVVGSINMTRPSINENRELSVITREPEVLAKLDNIFESDWKNSASEAVVPRKTTPTPILETLTKQSTWRTVQRALKITKPHHRKQSRSHHRHSLGKKKIFY